MAPKLRSSSALKSLYRSAGWYETRTTSFLLSCTSRTYTTDGRDSEGWKNFTRFRLLIHELLWTTVSLVKWPRLINTRGFMLPEPWLGRELCFGLRALFALDVVAGHFPVLKYATRNWQLASRAGKHDRQAVWYEKTFVRKLRLYLTIVRGRPEKESSMKCYHPYFFIKLLQDLAIDSKLQFDRR